MSVLDPHLVLAAVVGEDACREPWARETAVRLGRQGRAKLVEAADAEREGTTWVRPSTARTSGRTSPSPTVGGSLGDSSLTGGLIPDQLDLIVPTHSSRLRALKLDEQGYRTILGARCRASILIGQELTLTTPS